ncbi:hypothetical protein GZH49_09350 [Nocardia terpenica]
MKPKTHSSTDEGMPHQSADLPVSFDRRFILLRYTIGHSRLVLRSVPHSTPDYIEVTFEGVAGMKVVTYYEPLTIDVADSMQSEEMVQFCGLREPPRTVYRCYALKSDRGDGLVMSFGYHVWLHPREAESGQLTTEHQDSRLILRSGQETR